MFHQRGTKFRDLEFQLTDLYQIHPHPSCRKKIPESWAEGKPETRRSWIARKSVPHLKHGGLSSWNAMKRHKCPQQTESNALATVIPADQSVDTPLPFVCHNNSTSNRSDTSKMTSCFGPPSTSLPHLSCSLASVKRVAALKPNMETSRSRDEATWSKLWSEGIRYTPPVPLPPKTGFFLLITTFSCLSLALSLGPRMPMWRCSRTRSEDFPRRLSEQ